MQLLGGKLNDSDFYAIAEYRRITDMSIVPSRRAIEMYVGTVSDWMESVGVSWEEKDAIYCDHCPERDNEGFPWSCDKLCLNRKHELQRIEWNAEEDFGAFMDIQDSGGSGDK